MRKNCSFISLNNLRCNKYTKNVMCEFHTCIFPDCSNPCIGNKIIYRSNGIKKFVFVKFCLTHECPYSYPRSNIACQNTKLRQNCPFRYNEEYTTKSEFNCENSHTVELWYNW